MHIILLIMLIYMFHEYILQKNKEIMWFWKIVSLKIIKILKINKESYGKTTKSRNLNFAEATVYLKTSISWFVPIVYLPVHCFILLWTLIFSFYSSLAVCYCLFQSFIPCSVLGNSCSEWFVSVKQKNFGVHFLSFYFRARSCHRWRWQWFFVMLFLSFDKLKQVSVFHSICINDWQ